MKKIVMIVLSVLFLVAFLASSPAIAQNVCKASGDKTADGAIKASSGYLCGVTLSPGDASTTCILSLYNSTAATAGTELHAPLKTNAGALDMVGFFPPNLVLAQGGIYANVTASGGTCTFNVHYK